MSRISERIAKLEVAAGPRPRPQRVERHIIHGEPAEQEAQMAAIVAASPASFHIFRTIVGPVTRVNAP